MKIILCGYHWPGCMALHHLQRKAKNLFVYTHNHPDYVPDLAQLCRNLDIPHSLLDISHSPLPFTPDLIVSMHYRYILSPDVLHSARGNSFNLHPSLLPRYRGCSSLAWALINGDTEAGYTYHYMDEGIDSGNIILQKRLPIYSWDTGQTLNHRIMFSAMQDFDATVDLVVNGAIGTPQTGTASYYPRGCPFDGAIDDRWPDEFTERFIRALIYPPLPPARYKGHHIYRLEQYNTLRERLNSSTK